MYAYRASFALFQELVCENGLVIRRIEQPGGSARYVVIERNAAIEDYIRQPMNQESEWVEVGDDEISHWLTSAGEPSG